MGGKSLKEKVSRYIDAGIPIIYICSFEENKVDDIIDEIKTDREVYEWNGTNGYVNFENKTPMIEDFSFNSMLNLLKSKEFLERKIILFKDINAYLENPEIVSKIKGIADLIYKEVDANIIIVSSSIIIPREIEKCTTIIEMDYLNFEEIKKIITDFCEKYMKKNIEDSLIDELAIAFKGLTEYEITNLLRLSYADDGMISDTDLALIIEQKNQIIKKAGILEMIPLNESIDDIGGLDNLKTWLYRKAKVLKNIEKAKGFGVDIPKGVLIAGVPGCGKSLTAKATAKLFKVPLLRLDMGRLLGKYVGESEANLRRAISLADAISPCVLWIDELEKAFAGINGNGSGEVSTRLFGNFLTWMQEKESSTFVVATANDITQLPPELIRKGRFDEIFHIELPNDKERKKIFEIHINKRRPNDLSKINLNELVKLTVGFSGADIEGVIKDSVETAYADEKDCIFKKASN